MHINDIMQAGYQTAVEKGFWEGTTNFAEKLCLIHSEISEALEEYRDGSPIQVGYKDKYDKLKGIPFELADVILRVLNLCKHYDIDIEEAIKVKMKYNSERPYKHGKKF